MRTDMNADARLASRSHIQAWLFLAITAVAFIGAAALLTVSNIVGLYTPPPIAQLAAGTFDYANLLFLVMWAWIFQLLSIHDGLQYRLQLGMTRMARSRTSDVLIPIVHVAIAILWGAFAHEVFSDRAADPTFTTRLADGAVAVSLRHGADDITVTYFIIVGTVVALIVAVHLFNPVDLDEYERRLRRILHVPTPRNTVS